MDSLVKGISPIEKELQSISGELANYMVAKRNKNIFMVTRYEEFYISHVKIRQENEDIVSSVYSLVQNIDSLNNRFVIPQSLRFDDLGLLIRCFEKIQDNLPDPNETSVSKFKITNSRYFDCRGIFPELSGCLNRNDAEKIDFLSVNKIQKNTGGMMNVLIPVYESVVNCYTLDLKHNTISKYTKNIGQASDGEILFSALQGFRETNSLIAKPIK